MALAEYFAVAAPEDIGDELSGKVSDYYTYLTSSSLVDLWRRSYYAYYGLLPESSLSGFGLFAVGTIRAGGLLGEIANIKVNHYRNLLLHIHNMTTQEETALKCKAINSDSKNLAGAYLGDGILDYYVKEGGMDGGLDENFNACNEVAGIFGESFLLVDWDATAGDEYLPDGTSSQKTGDVKICVYNPFDVIRDTTADNPQQNWKILHDLENRFDLAAKFPHAADDVLTISTDHESPRRFIDPTKIIPAAGVGTKASDLIDTYTFWHEKTESVPQGRVTKFLSGGTVLIDGPLPHRRVPIYRHASANIKGTVFGYTVGFDLLGIQETVDKLTSSVVTNQLSNGIQNFWQPMGNQLTTIEIAGGLNLMESAVKPEVLELCATPKELFEFIPTLIKTMETLASVSAVNRGEIPSNLKSGSALAFMATTAITFNAGLQRSFKRLKEQVGTGVIKLLTENQVAEKTIAISGSFNRPLMKTFTGDQLKPVSSVYCENVSPMTKTLAGKIQIAQDLLQNGMIKNTQEYITLIKTGESEPMYESEMSEILLIRSENEDMRDGKSVTAILFDDHPQHILEHKTLLSNSDARRDAAMVTMVTQHIMMHEQLEMQLQMTNPMLLAIFKRGPLPMPQQPMGQPQQAQPGQQPQQLPAAQEKEPNMPGQPNMPKNSTPDDQAKYEQLQNGAQQ